MQLLMDCCAKIKRNLSKKFNDDSNKIGKTLQLKSICLLHRELLLPKRTSHNLPVGEEACFFDILTYMCMNGSAARRQSVAANTQMPNNKKDYVRF